MAKNKYLDNLPKGKISGYLSKAYEYVQSSDKSILKDIQDKKELTDSNEKKLVELINKFQELYKEEK